MRTYSSNESQANRRYCTLAAAEDLYGLSHHGIFHRINGQTYNNMDIMKCILRFKRIDSLAYPTFQQQAGPLAGPLASLQQQKEQAWVLEQVL